MSADGPRRRLARRTLGGTPASPWLAAVAVSVVTTLTAASVVGLVAYRHAAARPVASAPRFTSPSPAAAPPTAGRKVYLSVPSTNVIWALVDYHDIYRSTDRGDRWDQFAIPQESGVRPTISFINEHEGWLLAPGSPTTQCQEADPALWHTSDSGKTWNRVAARGIASAQCKEFIYFADATHGFVTAWDQNHAPKVYATSDAGATWRASTVPDNPIFSTGPGGFSLRVDWIKSFGGAIYLEATGTQHDRTWPTDFIYVSTNGGGTWTFKQKVPSHELVLVTQSRWLEIDPPSRLDESTNGGQAMGPFQSDLHIDPGAAPGQILFAGPSVGYVSRGGTLQRTIDGGTHWTGLAPPWSGSPSPSPGPTPTPTPNYFMPTPVLLDAPTRDVVWAFIPFDKVLFLSTDQGAHWELRNLPSDIGGSFPNATFLDEKEGWFLGGAAIGTAGEHVKIWHTTDGAETWQPFDVSGISDAQSKQNLVFVDRNHAFLTSSEENLLPRIYASSDGGHTWSGTTLLDPAKFQSVADGFSFGVGNVKSFGATVLASACGNGFLSSVAGCWVYSSVDGGAHWSELVALPAGAGGGEVVFLNATRWLIVQGQSGAVVSTDAGKTWNAFATDYSDAAGVPSAFVFADAQVGYGTVRGSFHRTLDGGAHWTSPSTPWMPLG